MFAIATKYLGATNYRPSRIKATSGSKSVTLSWDHGDKCNHRRAAAILASRMNAELLLDGAPVEPDTERTGYLFVAQYIINRRA